MKLLMNIVVLLLFFATVGCKKQPVPIIPYVQPKPSECDDTLKNLRPFWKVPIRKDTLRGIANHIVNLNNGILVFQGERDGSATLYSKNNGNIIWQKNGFEQNEYPFVDDYSIYSYQSSIVWSNTYYTHAYTKSSGNKIWDTKAIAKLRLDVRSNLIGNFLYNGLTGRSIF